MRVRAAAGADPVRDGSEHYVEQQADDERQQQFVDQLRERFHQLGWDEGGRGGQRHRGRSQWKSGGGSIVRGERCRIGGSRQWQRQPAQFVPQQRTQLPAVLLHHADHPEGVHPAGPGADLSTYYPPILLLDAARHAFQLPQVAAQPVYRAGPEQIHRQPEAPNHHAVQETPQSEAAVPGVYIQQPEQEAGPEHKPAQPATSAEGVRTEL